MRFHSAFALFLLLAASAIAAQRAEAAAAFEKAAALLGNAPSDPRLAATLQELGAAWLAAGDSGRAAQSWERLIALDPQNLTLRRQLAEQYLQHHLPAQAK